MVLFLLSKIGVPVLVKAESTSVTDEFPFFDFKIAHAPATWGAAIEVPDRKLKPPPGIELSIPPPAYG
jgi:hypothetical protein